MLLSVRDSPRFIFKFGVKKSRLHLANVFLAFVILDIEHAWKMYSLSEKTWNDIGNERVLNPIALKDWGGKSYNLSYQEKVWRMVNKYT